jgi:spore maturation protein CgeB
MADVKARLRKLAWLYRLSARLKCWQTKRSYRATLIRYTNMPLRYSDTPLTKLCLAEGRKTHRRPRVFFMGTDEQQDKSGFVQALQRVADVEAFTREDGAWGQNDPAAYEVRRLRNTRRLWELVSELSARGWIPDLLITQTWGFLVEPEMFSRIRNAFGTVIINIAMDDRHQYWGSRVNGGWDGTFPLTPHLDLTLTAAPEAVDWYQKEGGAALFSPEASDPGIFHPMPELPKVHDVCFVGGRYGIREKIVNSLRRAGIRVTAYGSGWEGGRLETNDVPRLFAQSKIVLGIGTIGHCEDFYALKMRDFDGPMSGSLYLTHDNPDLRLVYKVGDEIVTYRSIDDCIKKAKWFLAHADERERIAQAGRARASVDHTWDKRFNDLFAALRTGLTSPSFPLQSQ